MSVDLFGEEVAPVKSKLKQSACPKLSVPGPSDKPERKPFFAEVTKILPHYAVIYSKEVTGFFSGRPQKMPLFNKPAGGVSDKGSRRIGSALNWMILFSPMKTIYSRKENRYIRFKINFITLTLPSPQAHDDHYIKQRLLAPFLKWLERSWHVNSYVWKAEAQDNGNIHFHITLNQFVHWKAIRGKWNRLLAAHGYCKVFQDGTNDKGDAASQVKSVKKMAGIVSYIQGYITKKDVFKKKLSAACPWPGSEWQKRSYRIIRCVSSGSAVTKEYKRPIDGKLWSTSHNLAKINCFISMEEGNEYFDAQNSLLKDSKLIFQDKYIHLRGHTGLSKAKSHPLIKAKLKDIYNEHFTGENPQTSIEIESFY